jgi:decaprenyl-phosphate phosphoribosyltransferase
MQTAANDLSHHKGSVLIQFIRLARPRQWIKNLFVTAPLFFTPAALNPHNTVMVAIGTAIFCIASSSVYVLNDFMDRDADRMHPIKISRPIASGAVSTFLAICFFVVLAVLSIVSAFFLSYRFGILVVGYLLLQTAYSTGLKHIAILDVMIIAVGFVLRIFAGSAIIGAVPSPWIIVATGLISIFLALTKRRDDLALQLGSDHRRSLDGYSVAFLDVAIPVILGAFVVSYLMYTTNDAVINRLQSPHLYLTSVFVVAGILRYLQLTIVYQRTGAPTDIVLTDRFMMLINIGWVLAFGYIIYA